MAWSSLAKKVHGELLRTSLLTQNDRLLLACSGGLDSVAMVYIFLELRSRWNWELVLGHIDHGFRPEEDKRESELCRELAGKNGLDYLEESLKLSSPHHSLSFYEEKYGLQPAQARSEESLAREIRYRVLETWRYEKRCDHILTAHHRDDQAETLMYRFLTGSGYEGLRGIPRRRGKIVRPFLSVSRDELTNFVRERGLSYLEDSSNMSRLYARNRIRHDVLPFLKSAGFENVEDSLLRIADDAEDIKNLIDEMAAENYDGIVLETEECSRLDILKYSRMPAVLRYHILSRIIGRSLSGRHFSRVEIREADAFILKRETGREMHLKEGSILLDRDEALFLKEKSGMPQSRFHLEKNKNIALEGLGILSMEWISEPVFGRGEKVLYLPETLLGESCVVRGWRPGDRMTLFGGGQTKKISDILKDEHLSVNLKSNYPVLEIDGRIVWIPGIKRSNLYPVKNGEHVLALNLEARRDS